MKDFKTILFVEDNPKDVELTLEALGEYKLANQVVVVNDGVAAMDYLRCRGNHAKRKPENPAVILLDIKLPRMDGLEVLRAIRSEDALKTIPVVMLTSSRETPDLKTSYALGANAYVVKPVSFKEFIDAVKHLGVFWALINEVPPQ
nr:response regulator [Desulfobacula sp.]